jgi:hypothetical protein
MRFRLLRRRLALAAPRVTVRRAWPWPLRWLVIALLLGLCAALTFWAFESGKSIVGLNAETRKQLQELHAEVARLRQENLRQQEKINAADSLRTADHAAMETLSEHLRQLETDNGSLRGDLGFFERLIPATRGDKALSIRGIHAEMLGGGAQLRWQVLVIQPVRNAPEFKGHLQLVLTGLRAGEPWTSQPPAVDQPVQIQEYRRIEGVADLPAHTVVKTITARLLEGNSVRSSQTFSMN